MNISECGECVSVEGRRNILDGQIYIYCARWIEKCVPRKLNHAGLPPLILAENERLSYVDMACPETLP